MKTNAPTEINKYFDRIRGYLRYLKCWSIIRTLPPPGNLLYNMANAHVENTSDLLVKNLPRQFTDNDKESFLKHFGAKHVVCMAKIGKMVRN